ncbi:MAG: hypothetical protein M0R06_16225 [Sphaerochaeta sp.]|jgi:hypothetical protein|nr:hypothetical protein [Sphaerochaeta sp.]
MRGTKFLINLDRLPNMDLPLSLLASMGGANKQTARQMKSRGLIETYPLNGCNMVSVVEMERLRDEGIIVTVN